MTSLCNYVLTQVYKTSIFFQFNFSLPRSKHRHIQSLWFYGQKSVLSNTSTWHQFKILGLKRSSLSQQAVITDLKQQDFWHHETLVICSWYSWYTVETLSGSGSHVYMSCSLCGMMWQMLLQLYFNILIRGKRSRGHHLYESTEKHRMRISGAEE